MSKVPSLLTVKQVSEQLALTEQHVRALIRWGELEGSRVGTQWVVTEEALAKFAKALTKKQGIVLDRPRKSAELPKFKALSFFSGAMGLDCGLEKAGIDILLACENDKACRQTITANKPDIGLLGDVWKYSAEDIREAAGLTANDEIDLIVGGPPCQAFSTAGARKGFKDARGNALLRYIELILELKPKYAVIENVRGLLSAPLSHKPHAERKGALSKDELPGGALKYILELLKKGGYEVSFNLYNSANYGSPQVRERVVLICSKDGSKVPYLEPTHSSDGTYGLPAWKTFKDAVHDLAPGEHTFIEFPESRLKYYRLLGPGEYWKHLSAELQKEALGKSYFSGGGKTGFLRRLSWDKPSPTLVTHPAMPATDLAHPSEHRPLSVQEYKRIQQFPDDWKICGSVIDQYRQIGNAVPVGLGEAIGKAILTHMQKGTVRSYINFPYSRYKENDEISWEKKLIKIHTTLEEQVEPEIVNL